jgi:DNA end-binding protein Ku
VHVKAARNRTSCSLTPWPRPSRAAIAQLVSRGKEQLVLIRPYENGLIMHGLYYANEVRDFGQIPKGENVKLSQEELTLGTHLIEQMNGEFDPENYEDEYRIRVLAMLEEKSKGQEVTVTPAAEPRRGQVIDLMAALKQSLEKATPAKKAAPAKRKKRTAS